MRPVLDPGRLRIDPAAKVVPRGTSRRTIVIGFATSSSSSVPASPGFVERRCLPQIGIAEFLPRMRDAVTDTINGLVGDLSAGR